jgi:hypothetical protein
MGNRASPSVRCDYPSHTSAVYSHSCISTARSYTQYNLSSILQSFLHTRYSHTGTHPVRSYKCLQTVHVFRIRVVGCSRLRTARIWVTVSPGHLAWSRGSSASQSAHHFMYISLRHGHHRQDTTLHNTPYNTLRLLLPTAYSNTEDYKWLKLQIIRYSFFT